MDLDSAIFLHTTLTYAYLINSNLNNALLNSAILGDANFTDSVVTNADFVFTTPHGFTKEQLYSTASYKSKDLNGIDFGENTLSGWNFSGQNLRNVIFFSTKMIGANLCDANLSTTKFYDATLICADLRGATGFNGPNANTKNAIWPDGKIKGLNLYDGNELVVRDHSIAITVETAMVLDANSKLSLIMSDADWGSKMTASAGVVANLAGTLNVESADGYRPREGAEFTIIEASAGINGDFSSFTSNITTGLAGPTAFVRDVSTDPNQYVIVFAGLTGGDAQGDHTVNINDLVILKNSWNEPNGNNWVNGDFNGDGAVTINDLVSMRANWRWSLPTGAPEGSIPEPLTVSLLIAGLTGLLKRRRVSAA